MFFRLIVALGMGKWDICYPNPRLHFRLKKPDKVADQRIVKTPDFVVRTYKLL